VAPADARTILADARALLSDPERWTTGTLAQREDGLPVDPWSPSACCWCLVGALQCVARRGGAPYSDEYAAAYRALNRLLDQSDAVDFNDTAEHEDVLALLDRAIAEASRG
jgi:hypothetical protein